MEKAFVVISYSLEDQVRYASYKLSGEVEHWRSAKLRELEPDAETLTLETSHQMFNDKDFPKNLINRKGKEFLQLQ
ncbi:hypothetical protein Nepgr_026559 [Nepenthes gracilis]|uniref:Uncharacterized protein n=1 Tax=Nepenthes gracilis TaxID=150966 RepID=A0AAD3T8S2_NEPGR|nr:hypothetical protein Nepgr_026559 [Nepenthes gracilis]